MIQIFIAGILWGTIEIFVKELNALGADDSLTEFMPAVRDFEKENVI